MEGELAASGQRDSASESRCIVHIGMHKTGSTSIQLSLHGLDDDRFLYARLAGTPNHSLPIYSAFADTPERHHLHRANGRDRAAIQRYNDRVYRDLDRSARAARGRTVIISGEDIGSLQKRELLKLRDHLEPRFGKLTIAGYVRPPASFLASSFQQRVKSGALDFFDLKRMYRNYRAAFEKFDLVFGRERVLLWKFAPETFTDQDVVGDFVRRFGIPLRQAHQSRVNESLSAQAVIAFYIYNKFGKRAGTSLMRSAGGPALARLLEGPKFRLSPDCVRPVLEHNRDDIAWMEERLGQSLREELGEHRDNDVRDEADLLRPNPDIAAKLLSGLGRSAPRDVSGRTPEEIATLIDAFDRRQRYRDVGWWWRSIGRAFSA